MWALLKSGVAALLLGLLAYFVFFVDLGGDTISGHVAEIWRSEVVQHKVTLLKDGVKGTLEEKIAQAEQAEGKSLVKKLTGKNVDQLTAEDRKQLEVLLSDLNNPKD